MILDLCAPASIPLFWGTHSDPLFYNRPDYIGILFHFVELSVGVMGVVLNIILMITVLTDEYLKDERSSHLTLSLAMSDILICGGIVTTDSALFFAYFNHKVIRKPSLLGCQVWASFATLACCLSSLNIPAILLDRYVAVSRPLHYDWVMTGNRMATLLGSVWLISFCVSLVPLHFPFHKFCIAQNDSSLVEVEGGRSESGYHPLRLCDLEVNPPEAIALITVIIIVPAIILVVLCIMIFNVTIDHKKSVSYRHTLGRVKSLPSSPTYILHPREPREMKNLELLQESKPNTARSSTAEEPSILLREPREGLTTLGEGKIHSSNVDNVQSCKILMNRPSCEQERSNSFVDHIQVCPGEGKRSSSDVDIVKSSKILTNRQYSLSSEQERYHISFSEHMQESHIPPLEAAEGESSLKSLRHSAFQVTQYVNRMMYTSQNKAFRVLGLVVGTYLFGWLPLSMTTIVECIRPGTISRQLGQAVLKTAEFTACINPIVYSLSNKRLLDAMKCRFMKQAWRARKRSLETYALIKRRSMRIIQPNQDRQSS